MDVQDFRVVHLSPPWSSLDGKEADDVPELSEISHIMAKLMHVP